jgi:hypothetical protein
MKVLCDKNSSVFLNKKNKNKRAGSNLLKEL